MQGSTYRQIEKRMTVNSSGRKIMHEHRREKISNNTLVETIVDFRTGNDVVHVTEKLIQNNKISERSYTVPILTMSRVVNSNSDLLVTKRKKKASKKKVTKKKATKKKATKKKATKKKATKKKATQR
jgi:hypothetical protein